MTRTKPLRSNLGVIITLWTVLASASPVASQPARKIAVFTPGLTLRGVHEGLEEGLARLGYKEGQTITFIMGDTKGSISNLVAQAQKLVAAKPDVLVPVTVNHAIAAKQATATVPIVFAWIGDPVRVGLVASYASSKNNITGVASSADHLSGKRLEVLTDIAPRVRRLLVIVAPGEPIALSSLRFLEEAAKKVGVQLVRRDVTNAEEIKRSLRETPRGFVDAIFFLPSTLVRANIDLLFEKAKTERIPLSVNEESLVELGAVVSYGPNPRLVGIQTAALVDRVLRRAKPGEIVIETPNRFFLAVNLTAAKQIGLKIPRGILERADRVVE